MCLIEIAALHGDLGKWQLGLGLDEKARLLDAPQHLEFVWRHAGLLTKNPLETAPTDSGVAQVIVDIRFHPTQRTP